MEYKVWPCQTVGKPEHYSVAEPGKQPVFVDGAYYWPKDEAEAIARELNERRNTGATQR